MKNDILVIDPSIAGISGDMLLSSFIDLGADEKLVIDNIKNINIDKKPRSKIKPSDHTPIELELN